MSVKAEMGNMSDIKYCAGATLGQGSFQNARLGFEGPLTTNWSPMNALGFNANLFLSGVLQSSRASFFETVALLASSSKATGTVPVFWSDKGAFPVVAQAAWRGSGHVLRMAMGKTRVRVDQTVPT